MLEIFDRQTRGSRLDAILTRRATFDAEVDRVVQGILSDVQHRGDAAVRDHSETLDHVADPVLNVPQKQIDRALDALDADLRGVLEEAVANIRRFHERQRQHSWFEDSEDGVVLGQRVLPLNRVGLYVPGSTAFYPSSMLMNAIPAQVAGVEEIHVVSPPGPDGIPHPLVLACAGLLGIRQIHGVGGVQAIGALAYGTESISAVDKIVGPGNAYVAAAKRQVYGRVDIDAIAGPTEIVVLADDSADPEFVAADLLSQAEHDVRASAILVTPADALAEAVRAALSRLIPSLERRAIIEQSLATYGAAFVVESLDEGISVVNDLAPEHLEIVVRDPWSCVTRIRNAGAIFIGSFSPEPVGDYFAGPNHVLPTGGTARYASPLGVPDFLKRQSIIAYTETRLAVDGHKIMRFARAENLAAHALAIQVRLDRMNAGSASVRSSSDEVR